jgi:hypothetical protein
MLMNDEYKFIPRAGLAAVRKLKDYDFPSKYVADMKGNVYIHDISSKPKTIGGVVHILCKAMKPFTTKLGYVEFVLTDIHGKKKHIQGQRIVALLFIPNPKKLPHVNHKDGDRSNNLKGNLQWTTISENNKHAYRELGRKPWNHGLKKDTNGRYK